MPDPASHDSITISGRLALAVVTGAVIGLERNFHGRPAGEQRVRVKPI